MESPTGGAEDSTVAERHGLAVGRRVVVCGATGSGKTTFARSLGEALNLPVLEIDVLRGTTWELTLWDELREGVRESLANYPTGWVCDGFYPGRVGEIPLEQADTVIWLNLPLRVSFWRLLRRTVQGAWTKDQRVNRESWGRAFFSRHSILLSAIRQHGKYADNVRQRTSRIRDRAYMHELCSARQVQALLTLVKTRSVR